MRSGFIFFSIRIFVGNVRRPRATADAGAGAYLKPPDAAAAVVDEAWWRERAAAWDVDPTSIRIQPLHAALEAEWGPRYHARSRVWFPRRASRGSPSSVRSVSSCDV